MKSWPTWRMLEDHARRLGWTVSKIDSRRRFRKGRRGMQIGRVRVGWKITYFRDNILVDADVGDERAMKTLLYENLGIGLYF